MRTVGARRIIITVARLCRADSRDIRALVRSGFRDPRIRVIFFQKIFHPTAQYIIIPYSRRVHAAEALREICAVIILISNRANYL